MGGRNDMNKRSEYKIEFDPCTLSFFFLVLWYQLLYYCVNSSDNQCLEIDFMVH